MIMGTAEWFDSLSNSELRRRLKQRDVDEVLVGYYVANRELPAVRDILRDLLD